MMFGLREQFTYFQCAQCGCLQIAEIPNDLLKYYPTDYYSFSDIKPKGIFEVFKDLIKIQIIKFRLGKKNPLGYICTLFFNNYYWIFKGLCTYDSKILDIGCGNGERLLGLYKLGFKKLKGLDPFILQDIHYENGVIVLKKDISDLDEKFDFIMLHHSFEHIQVPKMTLQKIYNCLNPKSYVLIRIPIASSYAFRKYGINWVQIDAPRHLFLHTSSSIEILAKEIGFKLVKTIYDSNSFQFTGSERYENNVGLFEPYYFSKKQIKLFSKEALHLNNINDGDSACFYLYKE